MREVQQGKVSDMEQGPSCLISPRLLRGYYGNKHSDQFRLRWTFD